MAIQSLHPACADCGRKMTVSATASAWEFDLACDCGFIGLLSWAHCDPAPTLEQAQEDLFSLLGPDEPSEEPPADDQDEDMPEEVPDGV